MVATQLLFIWNGSKSCIPAPDAFFFFCYGWYKYPLQQD